MKKYLVIRLDMDENCQIEEITENATWRDRKMKIIRQRG